MHPQWENKISAYDFTKSKMANTRYLIEDVFSHKLNTINTVPVDIEFELDFNIPAYLPFYSQIVLDEELRNTTAPIRIYDQFHVYFLGTGDGGWLQIEKYIPDKLFRCNHGWIRTIHGHDVDRDNMSCIFFTNMG
jgi:hypothetical protein